MAWEVLKAVVRILLSFTHNSLWLSLCLSLSLSLHLSLSRGPSLSHTHTHTRTHALSLTHTHTHTHTYALSLSHTHSLTLSLRLILDWKTREYCLDRNFGEDVRCITPIYLFIKTLLSHLYTCRCIGQEIRKSGCLPVVCGACIGTAQVDISLVSLFDPLFKRSRLHCFDICLTWYLRYMKIWWQHLVPTYRVCTAPRYDTIPKLTCYMSCLFC